MGDAREGRIHFIAAGHYATETFGVKALAAHLSKKFRVPSNSPHGASPVTVQFR